MSRWMAWVLAAVLGVLGASVTGCRSGEGSDCLTDSDCKQGLICTKRTELICDTTYEEKWGTCFLDTDLDGIPDDGDLSGNTDDRRCGVQAVVHPVTGYEVVYNEVRSPCDDNCLEMSNPPKTLREFGCLARDACCPLSESEKQEAASCDLCSDRTKQVNSCATTCFEGGSPTPRTCYLDFAEGYNLDERGCAECRPLQGQRVSCTKDDVTGFDSCNDSLAAGDLIRPACSGKWKCPQSSLGFCKFEPFLANVPDADGYNINYQLDRDNDGLGDACDNCGDLPNGIGCENPLYEHRCDVDGDGVTSAAELVVGNQVNFDGDRFGDACDLCPELASINNKDNDGDGLGDPCDPDDDDDGICDPTVIDPSCRGSDNCQYTANPNQEDLDGDGKGDLCDTDRDADGIREDGDNSGVIGDNPCPSPAGDNRNCDDNCPNVPNGSGCNNKPEYCDVNMDGTTTAEEMALGNQRDTDDDGIGDACE